jgi:hypothetical protein
MMDYNLLRIYAAQIATGAMLVPLVMALFRRKKLNKALNIYFYFCLVTFLLDLAEITFIWSTGYYSDFFIPILNAYHIKNTNFLRVFFEVKNFIFLGWYFNIILPTVRQKKVALYVSVILIFSAVINYCFIQGMHTSSGFNSISSIIWSTILPLLSMWYEFNRDSLILLKRNPYFWINLGLIIMGVLSVFFYLVSDKLDATDPNNLLAKLSIAKNGIYILSLCFVTIGFYHARYTKYLPLK